MTSVEDSDARVDFAGIQALSSRSAGYAVALKCLEVQADAESRDPTLRTFERVKLHADAWSWYTGAIGEMEVGRLLSALGPEWSSRSTPSTTAMHPSGSETMFSVSTTRTLTI